MSHDEVIELIDELFRYKNIRGLGFGKRDSHGNWYLDCQLFNEQGFFGAPLDSVDCWADDRMRIVYFADRREYSIDIGTFREPMPVFRANFDRVKLFHHGNWELHLHCVVRDLPHRASTAIAQNSRKSNYEYLARFLPIDDSNIFPMESIS